METYVLIPITGSPHYFIATEVGLERDLIVHWTPGQDGWKPVVRHVEELEQSGELCKEGYVPFRVDEVDQEALQNTLAIQC